LTDGSWSNAEPTWLVTDYQPIQSMNLPMSYLHDLRSSS
jgi:hypothetical protein